jgi:hypothetical protein
LHNPQSPKHRLLTVDRVLVTRLQVKAHHVVTKASMWYSTTVPGSSRNLAKLNGVLACGPLIHPDTPCSHSQPHLRHQPQLHSMSCIHSSTSSGSTALETAARDVCTPAPACKHHGEALHDVCGASNMHCALASTLGSDQAFAKTGQGQYSPTLG